MYLCFLNYLLVLMVVQLLRRILKTMFSRIYNFLLATIQMRKPLLLTYL